VKRETLYFAWNETIHALQFTESAGKRFTADTDALETGSQMATSVAYIQNRLSDAQDSLGAAEGEIAKLIQQSQNG
jgi:hypothetical protein